MEKPITFLVTITPNDQSFELMISINQTELFTIPKVYINDFLISMAVAIEIQDYLMTQATRDARD